MRDKPWSDVLEWLADQTGLPVSTNYKPTGTFTFIAPKGANEYTIPQIVDILNENLVNQNYILIRRDQSYTIVLSDKEIDPALLPRILPEDLDRHGKTELVQVVLPLHSQVAEDTKPEVEKMLGPFGKVVALTRGNQLLVQDTVGNIIRIRKTLQGIEDTEKEQSDSYVHVCKYIKAREAERILKDLLGDPEKLLRALQPQPQFPNFAFNRGGGGGQPVPQLVQQPQQPAVNLPKIRMHYITVDERLNSVLVVGPADKISLAKKTMKDIDVPQHKEEKPVLVGPPELKTYAVPAGNAEAVAKTLQDIYKTSSTIRISAVNGTSIMVWAPPGDQFDIVEIIKGAREQSSAPQLVQLNTLDASWVVEKLKGMFGTDAKGGSPYIDTDTARNAVIVKGTAEQMVDVKTAIKALGEGGTVAGNMRIITIDKGSPAALAEELKRLLEQMEYPVKTIPAGDEENKKKSEPLVPQPKPRQRTDNEKSTSLNVNRDVLYVSQPLFDPQQKPADTNSKQPKKPSVNIAVVGNRIVITSDDPDALARAQDLVRLLTQTPKGQAAFEVIRLKNANAADAAKILDEAYNGPKPATQQQQFPFFGRGGNQAQLQQPTTPTEPRVRVVADPGSNSLLIKASALDMVEIRRLIRDSIDSGETDSKAILKTWVIGPLKNANVTEVATLIREVYREHINNNAVGMVVGGFPGFGFGGGGRFGAIGRGQVQNVDVNGNPRGVSLSIGIDDRTNSLIVNCSEAMYKDIDKLVKQLDLAAGNATRTVKVVPVKGIDPTLVQQAIDAIQGRRSTARPGMTPGAGGFQPGMQPFGRGFGGGGPGGGGGGNRPQGGTGPPGTGTGPRSSLDGPSRGPDFFVDRVKDDPQPSVLYDPQLDTGNRQPSARLSNSEQEAGSAASVIQLASHTEEQQPGGGTSADTGIRGPRSDVTAEALEQLGVVVISGNNPADVEEVVRIIDYIQKLGAGAEVQIEMVPLIYADATGVANTLSQLYQRVIVNAAGNIRSTTTAPTTTTIPGQLGPTITTSQQPASIVLLPVPRFNAILLGAPRARVSDIVKEIKRLDQPNSQTGRAIPFPLKKASASRVEALINNFYAQRYPNEPATAHQVRVTHDDSTNTVFVQAAPADLEEIRSLIERVETTVSNAINDVRIIYLRNALSDELSSLLSQSIAQGVAPATTGAPSIIPTAGAPGAPGAPGGALGALLRAGALPGAAPGAVTPAAPTTTAPTTTGTTTKSTTLRFISTRLGRPGVAESGLLEDIHITSDPRINALILSAPAKTMDLLLALISDLDVPPPSRATIKVFTLQKSDAATMAATIQALFLGTGGTGAAGAPGAPTFGGVPGAPGGAAVTAAPALGGPAIPRAQFTLGGITPEGAPLIPLGLTVDARTNSILIAGSRNDLEVIETIIARLEDSDITNRRNEVIHLRNASAPDVANALQGFLTNSLQVLSKAGQLTSFQELVRDVVVVPEPFTNKLLISATARYYNEIIRLVEQLDTQPPQVVIQVLIAEVDLTATEEFGCEIGLQSPVLFSRSVIPADGFFGPNGVVNFAAPAFGTSGTSLVPQGVTVNNSINPAAMPGFNFNTTQPLGNNPVVNPGIVGFQGLGNLGVGRTSSISNVGGFVFSAASDTFNVLIRALKTQGRMDVLSRPQIMALDNQTATLNVGENVPIVSATVLSGTGLATTSIDRLAVGVNLTVTPRINPDGTVLMRVTPEVSTITSTMYPLGNGLVGTSYNDQRVDTTVLAGDGETVAIGGLIQKTDTKNENKIPWFGDLPCVGAMFRFRTQQKKKTELLVIMTPHIVRSRADADRVLAEEAHRMDWVVGDVLKTQGRSGMAPIVQQPEPVQDTPAILLGQPSPIAAPATGTEIAPQPGKLPQTGAQGPALNPSQPNPIVPVDPKTPVPPDWTGGGSGKPSAPPATQSGQSGPAAPREPVKEGRIWKLFHPGS
jgi:type II secretory pathway component GspD/PulD (secretin)